MKVQFWRRPQVWRHLVQIESEKENLNHQLATLHETIQKADERISAYTTRIEMHDSLMSQIQGENERLNRELEQVTAERDLLATQVLTSYQDLFMIITNTGADPSLEIFDDYCQQDATVLKFSDYLLTISLLGEMKSLSSCTRK
jgi:hypothetical protein